TVAPIPQRLIGGMSGDMEKSIAAFVLSIFFVAPIVEEFVFRALIMTKLCKEVSTVTAIIISAILFASIHIMAGGIITAVHAFFGGLIFALSYVKSKSLFPAVAAHIFGNIGGCVPTITNSLPVSIQYVAAFVFLTAAIVFYVILTRKKEN
ncbi:MAG: CPBP family intramembrane metalloprotease, partial [Acetatifactor sp.]|nr:CPBP family intramembrane metalloprotease [Acetatifactor sp.]